MTKKKALWIALILVLMGAGLSGYYILTTSRRSQDAAAGNSSYQTAVAQTGDLTIVASGSGEIIPDSEIGLTFDQSGVVVDVLVNVGDQVEVGDVLARLKIDRTQAELRSEIAGAELAYVQAQRDLDALYRESEIQAANALIELENARVAIEEVMDLEMEKSSAMTAVTQARQAVEDAEMMLYIYHSSPSAGAVYTAYASLLFKESELESLQTELERAERKILGAKRENQRPRQRYVDQILQLNVAIAYQQKEVENATYQLNSIDDAADPLKISLAEAQLRTAQAQLAAAQGDLADLENGPDPGAIAEAQARLKQAQSNWEKIKDGPDPEEIARLETVLEEVRLILEIAQQDNPIINLAAPINGTVTALNINVGDRHNPGNVSRAADSGSSGSQTEIDGGETLLFGSQSSTTNTDSSLVTIADLSQPLIEAYIDETDFEKAAIGYPVEVVFDALPGETFTGEIVEISPKLETLGSSQAVRVLVRLDAASYAKPVPLPIGLTASIEVIAGQTVNAVLVPVDALVEVSPEEYVVYVVENDAVQPRAVSLGLMDFTSVEIIDGVRPGEIIAIDYDNMMGN
jgi:HlyD family secretion protein